MSLLRQAAGKFFCYATVFQAIELFSLAESEAEYRAIEDSMAAVKLLGLSPKGARSYGEMIQKLPRRTPWNVLIAGLCVESRLPLLTDRRQDFKGINKLVIVPTGLIEKYEDGTEILEIARAHRSG